MDERTALVTGASRGIGSAIAAALQDAGFRVLAGTRDPDGFSVTNPDIVPVRLDVTNEADLVEIRSAWTVDVLVNNAGIIGPSDGWSDDSKEAGSEVFDTNFHGAASACRVFVPEMMKRQWGRVVNVGSIYARSPSPYVSQYAASKAALLSFTRSLAIDTAPSGVTVNAVSPGNVDTEMTRSAGEDYVRDVEARTPCGRLAQASEIADAVTFLVRAPFICGHDLVVDGGLSLVGG